MKTIADVIALINENIATANEEVSEHNKGLLGPRTRGSLTIKGLESIDQNIPLEWFSRGRNGEDVYLGYCTELEGRLGAIGLEQALRNFLPVSQREGEHGPELFVDRPLDCLNEGDLPRENRFVVIVGDYNGTRTVFTWHPGLPLDPFDGVLRKGTAVKLHNG